MSIKDILGGKNAKSAQNTKIFVKLGKLSHQNTNPMVTTLVFMPRMAGISLGNTNISHGFIRAGGNIPYISRSIRLGSQIF